MAVVYLITNKITGKMYVGYTKHDHPWMRWYYHIRSRGTAISEAIHRYGKDAFLFEIIFRHPNEFVGLLVEKKLIRILNTITPDGYNICEGGGAGHFRIGRKLSKKTIKKMKANHADLRGEASGRTHLKEKQVRLMLAMRKAGVSCTDLGKRFGICRQAVSRITRGLRWSHITGES